MSCFSSAGEGGLIGCRSDGHRPTVKSLAAVLALALIGAAPANRAQALGGAAASESGRLDRRAVMVLGSRGNACTGTVLSPRIVITAAHCVSGSGRYAVAYREGGSPVLQEAAEVARHPEFRTGARVSIDIALVRLKLPLPDRFVVSGIDRDTDNDRVGDTLTVAGFGLMRDGDEASAGTLRQAGVTVLPRYYPRYLRLGRSAGDLQICRGDSGGPVFDADLRLVGVVYSKELSDGRECGSVAQAVRLAPQSGWIDRVIARWGG
jgi:hypothetical protein